jgi:hypothetical protein
MQKVTNVPLINRSNELNALKNWINQEPNYLLFLYGPQKCGKTTLLMTFIETQLNNNNYNTKYINLREHHIENYSDFIRIFFTSDNSQKRRKYKLFRLPEEIITSLENKTLDPFVVMKKELQKRVKKDKRPVLIIDEIQAIEDVYWNGYKEIFKELFDFFVSLTKESHLCHIVTAGSDGYFLNTIYNDSRLSKSCAYIEMDHLLHDEVVHWLTNLENKNDISLTEEQIETIWQYLGGCIFEISDVLKKFPKGRTLSNAKLLKILEKPISENVSALRFYASIRENKRALLRKINTIHQEKQIFSMNDLKSLLNNDIYNIETLNDELINMFRNHILAFSPITANYQLPRRSMYHGLKQYVDSIVF